MPVREYMGMYERFFTEAQNNRVEVRPLHMNVKRGNAGLAIEVYCEKKFFGKIDVQGSDVVYPEAQHLLLTLAGEEWRRINGALELWSECSRSICLTSFIGAKD